MRNTKSLLAIFLACMMVMSCIVVVPVVAAEAIGATAAYVEPTEWAETWDGSYASAFESGSGTVDDPYIIKTAAQLAFLSSSCNAGTTYSGEYIKLAANIKLNTVEVADDGTLTFTTQNPWKPIGDYTLSGDSGFQGTFDGDGYTVSGIYCSGLTDTKYAGFFGGIKNGTVKNLQIVDSYLNGTEGTGFICTIMRGNVTVSGVVIKNGHINMTGATNVGMILGHGGSGVVTIDNCNVQGVVKSNNASVGGLIGASTGSGAKTWSVTNSTVDVAVSGTTRVGGVLGYVSDYSSGSPFTVKNVAVKGSVTGSSDGVGGIIGEIASTNFKSLTVDNVTVDSTISGRNRVGGIMGSAQTVFSTCDITNTFVGNTITGTGFSVGGILGQTRHGGTKLSTENVLVDATIKGTCAVGGVIGQSLHATTYLTVANTVVLGSLETTGTEGGDPSGDIYRVGPNDIGALVGTYGYSAAAGANHTTINGFYYNATFKTADTTDKFDGTTNDGRLGSFYGNGADAILADGYAFYTPMTDITASVPGETFETNTNTVAKADNMGIADFVVSWKNGVGELDWYKARTCASCTSLSLGTNTDGDEVVLTCDKLCADALVKVGVAWDGGYTTDWYNNGVTENGVTTYTISTAKDLAGLAAIVNGTADGIEADDFAGDVIKLAANIYLNDTGSTANKWVPIGAYGAASGLYFRGTFDGQNKTIANMYIVDGNAYTGLFGYVGNGFNVKDLTISGANVAARNYGGILVSSIKEDVTEDMSFTNITVKDSVFSTNHANGGAAILGRVDTTSVSGKLTFENCSIVDTTVTGSKYLGGLVGYLKASTNVVIDGATVSGSVDATAGGTGDLMVGGLIGYVDGVASLNVTDVSVSSKITTDGARSGGIIGRIVGTTNCNLSGVEFSGSIEAYNNLGGFVGEANFTGTLNISDSTMSGSVAYVTSNNFYGGFIGSVNNANAVIELENLKLASTASVSGTGYVGGLVGAIRAVKSISIENCDVAGTISANNPVGAAIGGYHAASNAVTISGVNTTANITSNSSTHCGGIIGKLYTNSGTSIIENCRVATTGKNAGGLVGTVTGGTLTLGNNVVIGDYSEAAFVGNSGTVSQTTGTKIYVNGTVGNTAAVTTVTTADEAVVDFANAWGEATANYTAWSACSNCEGSGWIEKANAADGQYRVSCVDMCKGVTAEARSVSVVALGGSVRYLDPFGVRFGGRVYGAAEGSEYGVLMIPTTMLNGAELTVDNADALNALKIKAEKTFPSGEYYVDGAATFTGVVYDIPDTADAYDTQLTAVVYYTVDGVTYYSNVMTASYYDVAKLILADADWVAANSEAAATLQAVVDLVDAQ